MRGDTARLALGRCPRMWLSSWLSKTSSWRGWMRIELTRDASAAPRRRFWRPRRTPVRIHPRPLRAIFWLARPRQAVRWAVDRRHRVVDRSVAYFRCGEGSGREPGADHL